MVKICMVHGHALLCPTLGSPMDCSPPGSSVQGISQARILERVAISYSRGSLPDPGIEPMSPASTGGFFTTVPSIMYTSHMWLLFKSLKIKPLKPQSY